MECCHRPQGISDKAHTRVFRKLINDERRSIALPDTSKPISILPKPLRNHLVVLIASRKVAIHASPISERCQTPDRGL
jgi:hypothetical protein